MQQYCIPCEQWSVVHDNPHGNNTPSQPQWLVVHSLSIITAWQKRRRGTINFFHHHKDESSGLLLVLIPCLAFHHQFKLVEWEGVIYFHSINHLKIGNYRNKRKENQKMNKLAYLSLPLDIFSSEFNVKWRRCIRSQNQDGMSQLCACSDVFYLILVLPFFLYLKRGIKLGKVVFS